LDPFKEYVVGRMEDYPELSASRLQTEITGLGYNGKHTILREFVASRRPEAPMPIEL